MTRFAFFLLLPLSVVACSQVPPPPDGGAAGAGGEGGIGGMVGGGGDSGAGGMGGEAGCVRVSWSRTMLLEPNDILVADVGTGTVSSASDLVDRWSIQTCGGAHDITLSWDAMMLGFDLDLVLLDADGRVIERARMGDEEEIITGALLDAGELYFVDVEAVDTSGVDDLVYNVTVVVSE